MLYKIASDLIHDNNIDEAAQKKRLALCGIQFLQPAYCIQIIEFDMQIFSSFDVHEKEYLTALMYRQLTHHLTEPALQINQSYSQNRVAALLNVNEMQYNALEEQSTLFLKEFETVLRIPVNLVLSPVSHSLSDIHGIYMKALDYLKYTFIYSYGNVYLPARIEQYERNHWDYDPKELTRFENWIISDQVEPVYKLLADYEEHILEHHYSYQSVNRFLIQLYSVAFHAGKSIGLFDDPQSKAMVEEQFYHASNIKECFSCVRFIFNLYHATYIAKVETEDIRLIDSVKAYIQAHCESDVSLTVIADAFHVSSSHLSRLFKNITGSNFSSFVSDIKLEKAGDMLIAFPNQDINEIAEHLGYYTPAYFTRIFKQRFGVTPSQYRKQNSRPDFPDSRN